MGVIFIFYPILPVFSFSVLIVSLHGCIFIKLGILFQVISITSICSCFELDYIFMIRPVLCVKLVYITVVKVKPKSNLKSFWFLILKKITLNNMMPKAIYCLGAVDTS